MSIERQLVEDVAEFIEDPYGFVMWCFPWGEGELVGHDGPETWQADILKDVRDGIVSVESALRFAVASGHGVGKEIGCSVVYETPSGMRRWGDTKPGDLVFGRDGKPAKVLMIHPQGVKPLYRVTFDDGSSTLAGLEHLWAVRGRQERRKNLPGWRTLSTEQILEIGVKRPNGVAQARQWEVPIQGEAEFDEREIDIHPYLMGVWLGDGHRGQARYSKPFQEVADRVRSFGYDVSDESDGKAKYIRGIGHLLTDPVFDCRSPDRYIPDDYKFNTVENRKELLRGLLDTDGEVNKSGSIGYSSTSLRLAEDVIWLARSLGGKAMMHPTPKDAWYPDEDGNRVHCNTCYRVTINLPWNPFTIEHRRVAYNPSEERYLKRWIESIEYSHDEEAMCITVDAEDSLYLANDFIVTHNTALVSWLILWFMSTRPHCAGVVTANTKSQLTTKTWRELAVWKRRAINGHWFSYQGTRIEHVNHPDTWFIACIPWSADKPEAFAGLHARDVLVIYDEASAIDDGIWEVSEGAMTTPGAMWFAFGNPTRNTGRFRDCFGRFAHRWKTIHVDAREVTIANKAQIDEWVEDYGEDSDFVRVRVRGVFPRAGTQQFIGLDIVQEAFNRTGAKFGSVILGVDVARFGDDNTVILRRSANKLLGYEKYPETSVSRVVALVIEAIETYDPIGVFVDGAGVGGGVVDGLIQKGYDVIEVNGGERAAEDDRYYNLRAEMWGKMRTWLQRRAVLGQFDRELQDDMIGIEYGFDEKNRIQLERKKDMKKRGLRSPDIGDALALTHAYPLADEELVGESVLKATKIAPDTNPHAM